MKDEPIKSRTQDLGPGQELLDEMARAGYRGRIVSSRRARDLEEAVEAQKRAGLLDKDLCERYLCEFDFSPPNGLREARSLIIAAIPQPQIRFVFNLDGRRMPAIVPPTYLRPEDAERRLKEVVTAFLGPKGYSVVPAALPKKLLAVRSGLARYGRNNIAYVPGMGSFHRLTALYSDLPCDEDDWHEPRMLERCEKCPVCASQCPTGAISPDRFLLYARKCIVFHNEQPHGVPFPDWVEPAWHNCLVGCMLCQRACPENRDVIGWLEEPVEFSDEETRILLNMVPREVHKRPESLPPALLKKLEDTGLFREIDIIPRNLLALFEASGR